MIAVGEVTVASYSWDIVPTNIVAWVIVFALFLNLLFRQAIVILMLLGIFIAPLRELSFFPQRDERKKVIFKWLFAIGLFAALLLIGKIIGWVDFVPQQVD